MHLLLLLVHDFEFLLSFFQESAGNLKLFLAHAFLACRYQNLWRHTWEFSRYNRLDSVLVGKLQKLIFEDRLRTVKELEIWEPDGEARPIQLVSCLVFAFLVARITRSIEPLQQRAVTSERLTDRGLVANLVVAEAEIYKLREFGDGLERPVKLVKVGLHLRDLVAVEEEFLEFWQLRQRLQRADFVANEPQYFEVDKLFEWS